MGQPVKFIMTGKEGQKGDPAALAFDRAICEADRRGQYGMHKGF